MKSLARACAARLHGQGELAMFSLLLSGSAVAGLGAVAFGRWSIGLPVVCALAGAALVGLAERYLAVRLAIDARLFDGIAQDEVADLAALDQALAQLKLAPVTKAGRALAERTAGAMRLVRWHTHAVGLQALLLAVAVAAAFTKGTA